MKNLIILSILSLLALSCTKPEPDKAFTHPFSGDTNPWSEYEFADEENFTFAVISDLNGGERERIFSVAAEQLKLLRPEFVMSVGDLIDGGTEDKDQLQKEFDSFDERASRIGLPLFRVGGNHDLTNKVMREFWEERYGARYYHFRYKDVLFLVLDSEDYDDIRMQEIYLARAEAIKVLDSDSAEKAVTMEYFKMPERRTGEIRPDQSAYFEKVLEENKDVRWTFLFMHKPVWMREEKEGSLERIETALGERPYTVINGHFHNYSHQIRNDRDYIILGTTGGSQNPESDMAFDHITLVTMTNESPSIANIRLDGILDKTGHIPAGGDTLNFQVSRN